VLLALVATFFTFVAFNVVDSVPRVLCDISTYLLAQND
jgi:hypothetical protein